MFALYIFRQPFVHNLRVVTPDFPLFPFLFFADFYSLRFIVFSFKYISVLSGFFFVCHQDRGIIRLQLNCIIFGSRFKNISICFNHNQNSSKGKLTYKYYWCIIKCFNLMNNLYKFYACFGLWTFEIVLLARFPIHSLYYW